VKAPADGIVPECRAFYGFSHGFSREKLLWSTATPALFGGKRLLWSMAAPALFGGVLLPYITTANTARDMDRIRQALGEPRVSYWGTSYGTYLGAVYATLFRDRTDRMLFDSAIDPTHDVRCP
jgi:pimeloyl-ACP methyl ester carboxylesterase